MSASRELLAFKPADILGDKPRISIPSNVRTTSGNRYRPPRGRTHHRRGDSSTVGALLPGTAQSVRRMDASHGQEVPAEGHRTGAPVRLRASWADSRGARITRPEWRLTRKFRHLCVGGAKVPGGSGQTATYPKKTAASLSLRSLFHTGNKNPSASRQASS
jgi:hypothetical protein